MWKQRILVIEARALLKEKLKDLARLKKEAYYLEQFVMTADYITKTKKEKLTEKWKDKKQQNVKQKRNMLKVLAGGRS